MNHARKYYKRFPFQHILPQRFSLSFDNQSNLIEDIPSFQQFRLWIWHTLKNDYKRAQIGLVLLTETQARIYNRDYRHKDYATNILSFETDLSQPNTTLYGDLIICPQVVLREAIEQDKSPEAHFAHLAIHGTLHLMGYDHQDDEQAHIMENLERRFMAELGYNDPYAQDEQ